MITFEEALRIVRSQRPKCSTQAIGFRDALYRILAEDIYADMNMPPFDKSAMDGFACRRADIQSPLHVVATIPAGVFPEAPINEGECMRIMTGAPVPKGADCVIMVEHTETLDDGRIRYTLPSTASNICYLGEDVRQGSQILKKGTRLLPQHLAILASAGMVKCEVYAKPRIAIFSSGDELVEPHQIPAHSQIRNSNAYQIEAQVLALGAQPDYRGILPDDKKVSLENMAKALEDNHMLLVTGGVSAGDFDFIPHALEELGVKVHFSSLAVQPGKPTLFGTWKDKFVFGLPGNPVSSFVQFELLVKPLIYSMMGHDFQTIIPMAHAGTAISRKKAERQVFIPVCIGEDGLIRPVAYHGSAHIHAYVDAHALIDLEIGQFSIKEGDLVRVRSIQ